MIPSALWWTVVPVGLSTKMEICQQIIAGKCILLASSHLPWKEDLMQRVLAEVEAQDAELNCNVIDADAISGQDPLLFLGSYYDADQVPIKPLIQQRLREIRSCCWVRNIPQSDAAAWTQLARELFSGKEPFPFRLVLELPCITTRGIGRTVVINPQIERFDVYYFALSILATGRLGRRFKEYASTLCAELASGDVEQCYALCCTIDAVLRDPLTACSIDADLPARKQLVCRAQTRSISPLIDIGRLKLISVFRKRIEYILPQKDDYGNTLEDVSDVELRHLLHFHTTGSLSLTLKEKDMLLCLYNARNTISHLDILPYDRIQKTFLVLEELS